MKIYRVAMVGWMGCVGVYAQETQPAPRSPQTPTTPQTSLTTPATTQPAKPENTQTAKENTHERVATPPKTTTQPAGNSGPITGPPPKQPDPATAAATQPSDLIGSSAKAPHRLESIRNDIEQLLAAYHDASGQGREHLEEQLNQLAMRCEQWAGELPDPSQQLEASSVALQVLNTLALGAGDLQTAHDRVSRLQASAWKAKKLGHTLSNMLGDYWLLQVALFDICRAEIDLDARQHHTIERLEQFVEEQTTLGIGGGHAVDSRHWAMLEDVRFALLRLYDQRGMSDKASRLVDELRQGLHRENHARREYLDRWFGYCSVLGQRFDAKLVTEKGAAWSSQSHRGRVLLLHFWSDWARPSTSMIEDLRSKYPQLHSRGLDILSVRLGDADGQNEGLEVDWPTCTQRSGGVDLTGLFAIRTVPRFVVIDPQGKVAAIGSGLAILDQAERLLSGSERRLDDLPSLHANLKNQPQTVEKNPSNPPMRATTYRTGARLPPPGAENILPKPD